MMELARHIEILLLDNDCVIVPEFGGFMAHHSVSVYSENEALFLPPLRTLGFNPQLKLNDSLLAQSYVEAYDISYPEALRRIEDDINEVRQHIENEGFCELPNIGTLSLNEESNYDFVPCPSGILTPSLYALNSFEMLPLQSAKVETVKEPVADEEIQEPEETAEETSARVISIDVNKLKQIAVAAAALLLFIIISSPLGDGKHTTTELCSIDSSVLTKIIPGIQVEGSIPDYLMAADANDVTDTLCAEPSAPRIAPAGNIITEEPASDDILKHVKAKQSSKYTIVLASNVSKINADNYVSTLSKKGISDAYVMEGKGYRKVVCGSFASMEDAQEAVRELRHKEEFSGAWILKTAE